MSMLKKIIQEIVLPVVLCWLLMTIFVDVFTIPTVFKNSASPETAGKIGMIVFSRFNCFELVFSTLILIAALTRFPSRKLFYFALPLFSLSLLYNFYMTPMITNLGQALHSTPVGDVQHAIIQSQHAKFHVLYRQFDSAKILGLLVLFIVVLIERVRPKSQETL